MDVHVDQAGQDRVLAKIDHFGACRSGFAAVDCGDLAVGDGQQRIGDISAALDIE